MSHKLTEEIMRKSRAIFIFVLLSLFHGTSHADAGPDPWLDTFNVYKYFKNSGTCLYKKDDPATCERDLSAYTVEQYKKEWRFNGQSYGLATPETFNVDLDRNGVAETTVPKYSGNLATYTAKHYPTAIHHNGSVFFVHSGAVTLEGYDWFSNKGEKIGTTAGGGSKSAHPNFYNEAGKTAALGIFVSKYNPSSKTVSQPVLIHMKNTDDPHDNAVVNVDAQGYIYVLVAARGHWRGSFLYRIKTPGNINEFDDISPDTANYSPFDPSMGYVGIAYPKLFWVDSDGGYFRVIYTAYCKNSSCGGRNIYTAELRVNGANKASLTNRVHIAGFLGHYAIANAKGDDIVLAFNVHLNGSLDQRTNLYYMHSTDGGKTWKNANNSHVTLPMKTEASLAQVTARKYFNNGDNVTRRIYLKDINFSGTGDSKHPMILYVGVIYGTHAPSITADHYLAKAFFNGREWHQSRLTNEVDHAYSSGMLVPRSVDQFDVYYPRTPESKNNALAGGAISHRFTYGNYVYYGAGNYVTEQLQNPGTGSYLNNLCEFNYIRPIHNTTDAYGTVGIAAGGNPYQYSAYNPIVIIGYTQVQLLPYKISPSDLDNNGNIAVKAYDKNKGCAAP